MIVINYISVKQSQYANKRCTSAMEMPQVSSVLKIGMSSDSFTKEPSFTAKPLTIEWYRSLSPEQIVHNNEIVDKYIYDNHSENQ